MPEFSQPVAVRFQGHLSYAEWDARNRVLSGEALLEDLLLEAQGGDLLRWSIDQDALVLETAKAWSSGSRGQADHHFDTDPFAEAQPASAVRPPLRTGRPQPRNRKVRRTRQRATVESDYEWISSSVGILRQSLKTITENIANGGWDEPDAYWLRVRGEKLSAVNDFEELVAAESARIDPMAHQYAAALKALGVMRGRAILADEVGLGKTIEAGLVASELHVRGLASRFLIICPATLREQWKEELKDKFALEANIVTSGADPVDSQSLIMSLHMARNKIEDLHANEWDLVIVDEAHRLTGRTATKTRELITGLSARYMLFLTATPVQNDLLELYRLVELLRPGTFVSQRHFERAYVDSGNPRQPRKPADLRRLVSEVMIRTTRAQAGLDSVRRLPQDVRIHMTPQEQTAYDLTVRILREVLTAPGDHLMRGQLAQQLSLSPKGLWESASRIARTHPDPQTQKILRELADVAIDQGPTSRQRALVDLVKTWITDPDKGRVLVFTQHTRVLSDLLGVLEDQGIQAVGYHGGMSPTAKREALEAFRGHVKVLVSTEAGAEGLNLQHANAVINYDLPWNPMRIEQRIGRVHRVTQTRDVHVANMFAAGTIDEHVYTILVDKLRMFELLFGQITTILGEMEDGPSKSVSFEGQIRQALVAPSDAEMQRRLQALASSAGAASDRARDQLVDAGGVSAWMSPTLDHRANIRSEASELRPAAAERTRERQKAVEEFARDWLVLHGQQVVHQSEDFIAAELHDHLQGVMGAETVYLAFTPDALREHQGAELVAVGSPMFQDMLEAVQDAGDLLVWTLDLSELDNIRSYPGQASAADCALLSRSHTAPVGAGGTATWRVRDEANRFGDQVIDVSWGTPQVHREAHRPLPSGVAPKAVEGLLGGQVRTFAGKVAKACRPGISEVQQGWQNDVTAVFAEEHDRRLTQATAALEQYDEAYWPSQDRDHLEQAIADLRRERPPKVRVHAELLAVEVVSETSVSVHEVWRRRDGVTAAVTGQFDARAQVITLTGADGQPITTVGICDDGHGVDAERLGICPQCHTRSCLGCPPSAQPIHTCQVCTRSVCIGCLPADQVCALCERHTCDGCWDDGLCGTCSMPFEAAPEHSPTDVPGFLHTQGCHVRYGADDHLRAFAIRGSQRREVALIHASGEVVRWWTLDALAPVLVARALSASLRAGESGNVIVELRENALPAQPVIPDPHLLIAARESVNEEWTVNGVKVGKPEDPPRHSPLPTLALDQQQISAITRVLPDPPPQGTHIEVTTVHTASRTWLERSGLARWTATGGDQRIERAQWAPAGDRALTWLRDDTPAPSPEQRRIAVLPGTVALVTADSNRHSITVCTPSRQLPLATWPIHDRRSKATAGLEAAGLADMVACTVPDLANTSRYPAMPCAPGWAMTRRTWSDPSTQDVQVLALPPTKNGPDDRIHRIPLWGGPTKGRSSLRQGPGLLSASGRGALIDVSRALNKWWIRELGQSIDGAFASMLAVQASGAASIAVVEEWTRDDGQTLTCQGQWDAFSDSLRIKSGDGQPIEVMAACDAGHAYDLSGLSACAHCHTVACPQCPALVQPLQLCGVCGASLCSTCQPSDQSCALCARSACVDCWTGSTCTTCSAPDLIAVDQIRDLVPPYVMADGLNARRGQDSTRTVVALTGSQRRELLCWNAAGQLTDWWAVGTIDPATLAQALAIAAQSNTGGDIVVDTASVSADPVVVPSGGNVEIASAQGKTTQWRVDGATVPAVDFTGSVRPLAPSNGELHRILTKLLPCSPGTPVVITQVTIDTKTLVWVTADGMHARTMVGPDEHQQAAPWVAQTSGAQDSLIDIPRNWWQQPVMRFNTALSDFRAVLATVGTYRLLVCAADRSGRVAIWDLDGLRDNEAALAAGVAVSGEWTPIVVRARLAELPERTSVRSRFGLVTVTSRSWVGLLDPGEGPLTSATWWDIPTAEGEAKPRIPSTVLPKPVLLTNPTAAVRAFASSIGHLIPAPDKHETEAALLAAKSTFSANIAGVGRQGTYLTIPRGTPGAVVCAETGRRIKDPLLCDSGHLTSEVAECRYCNVWVCDRCLDAAVACDICAIPMCASCAGGYGRCPACRDLERPGWWTRRKFLKGLSDAEGVLIGEDKVHSVRLTLLPSKVLMTITETGTETTSEHPRTGPKASAFPPPR